MYRSPRVLVVDDHHDAADSFVMLLQTYGLEAFAAYDWEEALTALGRFQPNLTFVEIGMSGMNACDVVARIRALPGGKNIRLIALTVLGSRADRRLTARAGFDHHFLKPMSIDDLEGLISAQAMTREWPCSDAQRFWNALFEFKRRLSRDNSDRLANSRQTINESYTLLDTADNF